MSLRFIVCACERHGRLIGDGDAPATEIGSREMAEALFAQALSSGAFDPGQYAEARQSLARSMLALKEFGIEDALRQRLLLWNLAAASTNDPAAFAKTDFHAYHALVDDFGSE